MEQQIEYGGARSRGFRAQANLDLDGFEAQIIADCMEDDFSLRQTLAEVNLYREFHDVSGAELMESCPRDVGFNSVYACYEAMEKIESAVLDAAQGKSDPSSAWAQARFCWITFLMVSFGQLAVPALREAFDLTTPDQTLPDWANPDIVTQISLNQVAWADGVHKKPVTGGQGHDSHGSRREVRFYRNEDGFAVPADTPGATVKERKAQLKCKYTKESRFLCIAMVKEFVNGQIQATVLETFVYSQCWLHAIKDFMGVIGGVGGKRGEQIQYIKEHGPATQWVIGGREKGALYMSDQCLKRWFSSAGCCLSTGATPARGGHTPRSAIPQRLWPGTPTATSTWTTPWPGTLR